MDRKVKERMEKIKKKPGYEKLSKEFDQATVDAKRSGWKKDKVDNALRVDALLRALESDALGPLQSEELEKLKKKPRQRK